MESANDIMSPMSLSALKHKSSLLAGVGMVLGNRLLLRTGVRRRIDGWRRAAGLVLRGEAATFVLSAFGLDVWSDAGKPSPLSVEATKSHLESRLAKFLAAEVDCHRCVKRGEDEDGTQAHSGPTYTLAFQPWIDGPTRFVRPETWAGKDCSAQRADSTDVLLNFVCRISPDGAADVWVRINHIAIDGVPVQEIMSRLESAWGTLYEVIYPTPQAFAAHAGPRDCVGRDGCVEMQTFVDFSPLLTWRKAENARLPESMTVSAAIIWNLAKHPTFSNRYIGTTVEVPAIDDLGRGVGINVVRPADYFQRKDGLAQYVREFNRQLELNRTRASVGNKTLDAAAFLPSKLANRLIRHAIEGGRAFGTVGLTMLRDAKVFGAPLGDVGHLDGFLAIGSIALPTANGSKVGCVTIKGPAGRVLDYPRMIREAIEQCAAG